MSKLEAIAMIPGNGHVSKDITGDNISECCILHIDGYILRAKHVYDGTKYLMQKNSQRQHVIL